VPISPYAARFRRAAYQRLEAAEVLFKHGYYTDAVYLSGYAVECILKALALSRQPATKHAGVVKMFRGRAAHDYEWIKRRYLPGLLPPKEVVRALASVRTWAPDIRYETKKYASADAKRFLSNVAQIMKWCEGQLQ
jgi:HEPN domain-containing protein